jgi:hypothetical protein
MTEYADVRIQWLPTTESGRTTPVHVRRQGSASYRPHFRVGDRGEFLGVQFVDGVPPVAAPGDEGDAMVELLYVATGVDYRSLAAGATFDVLEGARVIGRGTVLRRFEVPPDTPPNLSGRDDR